MSIQSTALLFVVVACIWNPALVLETICTTPPAVTKYCASGSLFTKATWHVAAAAKVQVPRRLFEMLLLAEMPSTLSTLAPDAEATSEAIPLLKVALATLIVPVPMLTGTEPNADPPAATQRALG